jgi:hypothetical protein
VRTEDWPVSFLLFLYLKKKKEKKKGFMTNSVAI